MEIYNTTPFTFASQVGRINFPDHSLTLMVKGTFDLQQGGGATVAEEQLYPAGDAYYPDDEQMQSVKYESDFAYYKPKTDLLLVGACYAPESKPVEACRATFRVGSVESALAVFGNRHWNRFLKTISRPEPFVKMEIRYENSFGGAGYDRNPIGKGYADRAGEGRDHLIPLPNLESFDNLIRSPDSRPEPAGFGPLNKMWQHRSALLGTYQDQWLKERWPWFPVDFNWAYYCSAPDGLQQEGYLRGDEPLFFENLHPEISEYRSRLPGLRVRCFVSRVKASLEEDPEFEEVAMNLDTLWVAMEDGQLVLVWRGNMNIASEQHEEIKICFITSESCDAPVRTIDELKKEYLTLLANEEAIFAEEVPDEPDIDLGKEIAYQEALVRKALEQAQEELRSAGIDVSPDIAPPDEQSKELEDRLLAQLGISEAGQEEPYSREIVGRRISSGESLAQADLSELDLSGMDLSGGDFTGALFVNARLEHAVLDGAILVEAQFEDCHMSGASLQDVDATNADFTGASMVNVTLKRSIANDAIFDGALLERADLEQATASNASFAGADLSEASLRDGTLDGADFSRAMLNRADFAGARLKEASVEGAVGDGISMAGCDLSELRASEGCEFINGNFSEIQGVESIWEQANLRGATFVNALLTGADFSSASLLEADFRGGDLRQARFMYADLRQARCGGANFFEASFEKADLYETNFQGANCYGAEFLDACVERTDFAAANLKMTKLHTIKR